MAVKDSLIAAAFSAAEGAVRRGGEGLGNGLFQAILDVLPQHLCVLDGTGKIVVVNRAWQSFATLSGSGVLAPVGVGSDYLAVCARLGEEDGNVRAARSNIAASCSAGIQAVLHGLDRSFLLEYPVAGPEGERWFVLRVAALALPGALHVLICHEDISERRRTEVALRENALALRRLAGHLESVREEEGARIAGEVHDELGGTLTMLKLGLASILEQLERSPPRRETLVSLLQLSQSSIDISKRISSSLRPRMLDTLGLVETIRWHAAEFSRHTGIACTVHLPEYIRISPERSTAVYRVVQEALTNVARHAHARQVALRAQKNRGDLMLEICDDGRGVAEADLLKGNSYGILGMRERSQYLGGEFSIRGEPGQGTRICLRLPLAP